MPLHLCRHKPYCIEYLIAGNFLVCARIVNKQEIIKSISRIVTVSKGYGILTIQKKDGNTFRVHVRNMNHIVYNYSILTREQVIDKYFDYFI